MRLASPQPSPRLRRRSNASPPGQHLPFPKQPKPVQATIPLVEMNSYQRPWFLRSLAASPLFIVLYLELFSWQVRHGPRLQLGLFRRGT